jgi:hypothetical protein
MENTEVAKHWQTMFKRMGYRETRFKNWIEETRDLFVVLRVLTLPGDFQFYIDVGIIIKNLHDDTIKKPSFLEHHLGQSLWLLLYKLDEIKHNEQYLNKLFCFDPAINTDKKVMVNISELAMLYLAEVIPLIDQLDYWARDEKKWDNKITWSPYYRFFLPSINVDSCYR